MQSLGEWRNYVRVIWSILGFFLALFIVKVYRVIWLNPKLQEKCLRNQGIYGPPYKLWPRDKQNLNEMLPKLPNTTPSHDILHRLDPLTNDSIKQYGKMFYLWRGIAARVVLLEPKLIKEMLTNKNGEFEKPEINAFTRLFFAGVSSLNGEKWVTRRKLLNPAFHMLKVKGMLPSVSTCIKEMIRNWEEVLGSKNSCELDVCSEFQKLTADVISRVAFGSNYEEGSQVFKLLNEQGKLFNEVYYIAAFPWLRHLPTKTNARMKCIYKEVTSTLRGIIEKRKEKIKNGSDYASDDLLGLMLESSQIEQQEASMKKSSNGAMTIDEIIGECKLFYFAGHETTATLLSWTIIALSMHQEWQDKAREEVLTLIDPEKVPTVDDLARLKTVNMVFQETLRLYPPSSMIRVIGPKGAKLGDKYIPYGAHVFVPTPFLHRDEQVWGKDALEFNPGRFSDGVSKASDNDSAPYFPFGWGPRVCIGQNLAMIEAKMTLSMLLQRYSFEISPSYAHVPHFILTLQPLHGAQVIIHRL